MTPLLEIDGLDVSIASRQILFGVSLHLAKGESLGIIGETGAGKTMALRAITGLLPSVGGRVDAGAIRVKGLDVTGQRMRRRQRGVVSMVPQAGMSSLDPLQRISSQLREALQLASPTPVADDDVVASLTAVGLDPTPRSSAP